MVAGVLRYCFCLNFTFLVNSAAHLWGIRPYDKKANPAENFLVSLVTTGEGWHNYHHAFPQVRVCHHCRRIAQLSPHIPAGESVLICHHWRRMAKLSPRIPTGMSMAPP